MITIVIEEQRQVVRADVSELENVGGKTCNLPSIRSQLVDCQGRDDAIMFAKVEINRLDQLFDIGSNPPRSGCRKIVIEAKKLGMQHKAVMRPFREIHPLQGSFRPLCKPGQEFAVGIDPDLIVHRRVREHQSDGSGKRCLNRALVRMGLGIYRNEQPRSRSRCLLTVEHIYDEIGKPVLYFQFHGKGLFEAHPAQLEAAMRLGAPVVEFHTGEYAHATGEQRAVELKRIADMAALAVKNGIEPHAGHGLTFENVQPIAAIPQLAELNIGHYLVGEAIFTGLEPAIRRMRDLMDDAR